MLKNLNRLPKILLVAEHASAIFGGEALIPFQYFKHLRKHGLDVHLLVHARTRVELCRAFPEDIHRLHFVDDSLVNIWCYKLGKLLPDRLAVFTLGAISHLDTQVRQRSLIRYLIRKYCFDILHEPIPVSPKLPSMLFGFDPPVVIGPMNGGMDFPPNYHMDSPLERVAVAFLRATSSFWNALLPGKKKASLLLVANTRTYDALPENLKTNRIVEFVENGVDLELFQPRASHTPGQPFRIIHIGRLVDVKRVDLLIDACARLKGKIEFELDLVGDGPLRGVLQEQVRRLALEDQIRFCGRLPQAVAAERLRDADLMVLTSMRECGGAVVLESMASGVPVIAAKWGGPADYITEDTGILVPPATPSKFVDNLGEAILRMAGNPDLRATMGECGRRRASEFYEWHNKAQALIKIYQEVIAFRNMQTNTAGA